MSAAPFVIPTVYQAYDQMTAPIRQMMNSVRSFSSVTENAFVRADKHLNRFLPGLTEGAKQMLNFARSAAIFTAVMATISFSVKQVMAYEDALNSFRTIVSDLTNQEFAAYQSKIIDVAKDTRRSSVVVAQSFETIAGLNADFARTADGLSAVSSAAITLSKASKMELQPASEALVGTMNQFQLSAKEADRVINVMAAGTAVGAASIAQVSGSLKNFGSTAYAANLSLEQTNALIQVMGKYSLFGEEAGTKLRGSVLKLQQAGAGYASGQFVLSDALEDVRKKMAHLHTAKQQDAYLNKVFGAENISTGRILINNIETYKQFTAAVTGTSEAQRAAEINSNSLSNRITELQAKWVTMITSTNQANDSLSFAKNTIVFVTDNLETLTAIALYATGTFIAWKAIVWGSQAAMVAYNIAVGISAALQGKSAFYTIGSTVAYKAYRATIVAATAAQWLLNVAMNANPIGLIITGIGLLIGAVVLIIKYWDSWGETVTAFLGPLGLVISLIQSFRRNWNLIVKTFREGGILEGLKMIGKTIFDAILSPLQKILELASNLPGIGGAFAFAANKIREYREGSGMAMYNNTVQQKVLDYQRSNTPYPARIMPEASDKIAPRLSTEEVRNQLAALRLETKDQQKVQIEIKDETGKVRVSGTQGSPSVKLTPTLGQFGN